ncbi:MAG: glycosyltransferase [Lachnospiraceae bacterium]
MQEKILYLLGLILVIAYIGIGIDDVIWDVVTIWKRNKAKKPILNFRDLEHILPKLIAVVIAAWNEEDVLFDVVENIILSQQYPKSMYHIFLGVYPNDKDTVCIAQQLECKYFNVHCVINEQEGPTSKAQNINYVISKIKEFEKEKKWKFLSITVHDSEDLVHPYEIKFTNYLLEQYPAIQFPVFPLIEKPTIFNFFKNITTNTYADEFAENHFITMVSRKEVGAFVPSAGTGFSIRRDTVDVLGYHVLPENSLTEDYKLSLTLYENGLHLHYVLEKLERLNFQGRKQIEYIATRSLFPNTFKAAVKQKTRWTLGITMQSLEFKDVFCKNISFAGKYSLYRDQKAKIANLVSVIGYLVLIYFVLSLFIPVTPIYPKYSFSWYLCLVVVIMMIERQVFRGISLKNIYGMRSVFFGCLFPPLIPLRIIWGNIINFVATISAYKQLAKEKKKHKEKETQIKVEKTKNMEWSKTKHSFLEEDILLRFHRRFGDVLVVKKYTDINTLKKFLDKKKEKEFLGETMVKSKVITKEQFLDALITVKNVPIIRMESLDFYDFSSVKKEFTKEFLLKYMILPLLKTKKGYVIAYGVSSPIQTQAFLKEQYKLDSQTVLALDDTIFEGIRKIYNQEKQYEKNGFIKCLEKEQITVEQLVLIKNYRIESKESEISIAHQMGIHIL